MKTKEEILSEITDIPLYRIKADDNGEYITKKGALLAMEEYRSQASELPSDLPHYTEEEIAISEGVRTLVLDGVPDTIKATYMAGQIMGHQDLLKLASPLLASRDARIRELEEELKTWQLIEDGYRFDNTSERETKAKNDENGTKI